MSYFVANRSDGSVTCADPGDEFHPGKLGRTGGDALAGFDFLSESDTDELGLAAARRGLSNRSRQDIGAGRRKGAGIDVVDKRGFEQTGCTRAAAGTRRSGGP